MRLRLPDMSKLPPFTKNFFFITGSLFFCWMLFMDSNDLISQVRLKAKLNNLEDEKAYYQEKIEEVKEDREQLFSNKAMLERFAREKYLMKKDDEDIYVIVEQE